MDQNHQKTASVHLAVQSLETNAQAWTQEERARDTLHGAGATNVQDNGAQTDNLDAATSTAVLPDEDPDSPGVTKGVHEGWPTMSAL